MESFDLCVICATILILSLGVVYCIYDYNIRALDENPYNKCLDNCKRVFQSEKLDCIQMCNNDLKFIVNRTLNSVDNYILRK